MSMDIDLSGMPERPAAPKLPLLLLAAPIAISPAAVHAQQASAVMTVSATVAENCSVTAQSMIFTLDTAGGNARAQAPIAVSCTPGTAYAIGLDPGLHGDGQVRRMRDPATGEYLAYEIFSDGAHSARWGGDVGVDTVSGQAQPDGERRIFHAYGRVRQQAARIEAGNYSDSIVVTVNF